MKRIITIGFILVFLALPVRIDASSTTQLQTKSNIIQTTVGNPTTPIGATGLAAIAAQLANTVKTACNGAVTSENISCLQGLSLPGIPNPNLAINELINSATQNYCSDTSSETCLQCVGFVQAIVAGDFGTDLGILGNAKDYAQDIPGYKYISESSGTPVQEGDIVIKTNETYGHIAVVTKVYDQNRIEVAEADFNYGGEVGVNNSTISQWSGWLRKQ